MAMEKIINLAKAKSINNDKSNMSKNHIFFKEFLIMCLHCLWATCRIVIYMLWTAVSIYPVHVIQMWNRTLMALVNGS